MRFSHEKNQFSKRRYLHNDHIAIELKEKKGREKRRGGGRKRKKERKEKRGKIFKLNYQQNLE